MAVTVVSNPPVSPAIISASHPVVIEMSSTKYGDPGITQFRYVATITALLDLGQKFTVVKALPSVGEFDLSETFKTLLFLRPEEWDGGSWDENTPPITQIITPLQQAAYVVWTFNVQISEQYYDAGVFTENLGSLLVFAAARGFSDDPNYLWYLANWWQFNGLSNFITYSGLTPQVLAQRTEDPTWPTKAASPYMRFWITQLNGGATIVDSFITRTNLGFQGCVYLQLHIPGHTDIASFTGIQIRVYTGISPISWVLQEIQTYQKTIELCEDPEWKIMFMDRFHQYSFLSFNRKNKKTVTTRPNQAESIQSGIVGGRYRYNVEASNILTLNTNWMREEQNPLVEDLMITDQSYLVDPDDGSLTQVTVVPNSLRIKTSRNDNMIQYAISFQTSLDTFQP